MDLKEKSLKYHSFPIAGKIEVMPSKPCKTQDDLSCAYTPGVAFPCLEIKADQSLVSTYTRRKNLVGVITNGTAVLGLGNIGPYAGKPVMEGKGVLFKRFADVDVFDLELDCSDPKAFIDAVKLMGPTFGGINLEDIKAPECFEIEDSLKAVMDIPVFHDDQHGTAIITGAALLNALEIIGKKIDQVKVVINGAGAAGIACGKFYIALGVRKENITMCDTKGIIYKGRPAGMNQYKEFFATGTKAGTLADALKGADVFLGLSGKGLVTGEMLKTMNADPNCVCPCQPGPGDNLSRGNCCTGRCHHGHRPLRLSEPGEQCDGLPVHLPRCPGCGGIGHKRRDEGGCLPCPGRPCKAAGAGRGAQGLWCQEPGVRPGLHYTEAL